jgi:hypothetical protein
MEALTRAATALLAEGEQLSNAAAGFLIVILGAAVAGLAAAVRARRARTPHVHTLQQLFFTQTLPAWRAERSSHRDQFRAKFRIRERLIDAEIIPRILRSCPEAVATSACAHQRPLKDRILIALYRLTDGRSVRDTCEYFGCSAAAASTQVYETWAYMVRALQGEYLHALYPDTPEKLQKYAAGFKRATKGAFTNVVGALDGTHVRIKTKFAGEDMRPYYNRKRYASINCQVICNADLLVWDVPGIGAGGFADSTLFKTSPTWANIHDTLGDYVLLADSGYGISYNVQTPYRPTTISRMPPAHAHLLTHYNLQHSRARVAVERFNGVLKSRFRTLLHGGDFGNVQSFVLAFMVGVLLHNMCIMHGDPQAADPTIAHEELENPNQVDHLATAYRATFDERFDAFQAYITKGKDPPDGITHRFRMHREMTYGVTRRRRAQANASAES